MNELKILVEQAGYLARRIQNFRCPWCGKTHMKFVGLQIHCEDCNFDATIDDFNIQTGRAFYDDSME